MRFSDLTREQKIEVKQRLLVDRMEKERKSPSWGELSEVDKIISEEECEEAFAETEFVSDDFMCGVAADRDGVINGIKEWVEDHLACNGLVSGEMSADFKRGVECAKRTLLKHLEEIR